MAASKEEIIKAVKTISEVCDEAQYCEHCPFGTSGGDCLIVRDSPASWTINGKSEIWRALV